ncbi:MAG: Gfo/Idh/MocA family oxidoreductase [Cytophagales bacterium]|nr:Gfo/Idh/MocA family oxidoreductase [Cytophagales bacterium]
MSNRRNFIKTIGTGAASLALQPAFSNIIIPGQKVLGVALVGLGYYSRDLLAPALQRTNHCKLTGIVTGTPAKISRWQRNYSIKDKNVYNYQNMHEIASNDEIDVIYIVLPTGLHAKYSVIAANTGKHVWCEKPMAVTTNECQQMIDACRKNKVKLSIGYRMQHEPNTQTVMKYAVSKPYGKITALKAEAGYYDGRTNHWKQNKALGGGAMYDMGVYPLNALRYATGQEPIRVSARHETNRPKVYDEVDETTFFELDFGAGLKGQGATSLGAGMNELTVTCENGWYNLIPMQAYGGVQGRTSDGVQLNQRIDNQQAKQMDDDALAIINDSPVLVPGEEGQRDIRIVEAIYQSAKTNQPVDL